MSSELDATCAWLRGQLQVRLEALRDASASPRPALAVWLAGAAATTHTAPSSPPRTRALDELAARLELDAPEIAMAAVLLAVAVEPGLGVALGTLCDPLGREGATREAIASVLGLAPTFRLVAEDASVRWGVFAAADIGLALDPAIEARLLGRPARDASLVAQLALVPRRDPLPHWPVAATTAQVERAIRAGARSVRIWLRGTPGSGRRTCFAEIAHALGLTAATLGATPESATRAALRLARIDDLALVWGEGLRLPTDLAPPALQGWLGAEPPPPAAAGVVDLTVAIPPPDRAGRRAAWASIVPAFDAWTAPAQALLVDGWSARPGQLTALALAGVTEPAEAAARLRAEATEQLESHAEVLATPFEWSDLVLPPALLTSLEELAFEARALPALWDEPALGRLFPQGRSVTALFCGAPGTGKTMAAQVIARAIGLPLFRVDLSRVVSKYIGETSQNLGRVLAAARHTDAVILFDEADALFGKRTDVKDAHDRYANTDTDYLLQALDSWPGIALLATNRRAAIDVAFSRRMRTILEFPRRDAAERLRLWRQLAEAIVPGRTDELRGAIEQLAASTELSGAQIKSALLTARLVAMRDARAVAPEHLVRGLERELEKEGRSLDARDRAAGR